MLTTHWGGTWADAEKATGNTEDDLMCWAATAANVLEWTGWGKTAGMTDADQVFAYFQDHWQDRGGNMYFGWEWWFDGTNDSQGDPWTDDGWAQVDVPGGGFYPGLDFADYYRYDHVNAEADAMADVETYLRAGYGVGLSIAGPASNHAVTCWGYDYDADYTAADPANYYLGLWLTDSDDNKGGPAPRPDELRRYGVSLTAEDTWQLSGRLGDYHVIEVQGLAGRPVPEPVTMAGLMLGVGTLGGYLRQRRSALHERTLGSRPAPCEDRTRIKRAETGT
jgi:hypothetical protein